MESQEQKSKSIKEESKNAEILAFNGWHIINYNEFIADVDEDGVLYRIFYNPISEKFIANKIVSFNYDGKGMTLLENPANLEVSKKYEEICIKLMKEDNLPKKNRLDTANNLYLRMKKSIEKWNKEEEAIKKTVGNEPKPIYKKALLWCVRNHPKNLKYKRPTLVRAYIKFGKKDGHIQDSFIKTLGGKWNVLIKDYGREPKEFRDENSMEIYAKNKCKILPNERKQRV
jgi:hypothetical protein